jgi:hypothetical protein
MTYQQWLGLMGAGGGGGAAPPSPFPGQQMPQGFGGGSAPNSTWLWGNPYIPRPAQFNDAVLRQWSPAVPDTPGVPASDVALPPNTFQMGFQSGPNNFIPPEPDLLPSPSPTPDQPMTQGFGYDPLNPVQAMPDATAAPVPAFYPAGVPALAQDTPFTSQDIWNAPAPNLDPWGFPYPQGQSAPTGDTPAPASFAGGGIPALQPDVTLTANDIYNAPVSLDPWGFPYPQGGEPAVDTIGGPQVFTPTDTSGADIPLVPPGTTYPSTYPSEGVPGAGPVVPGVDPLAGPLQGSQGLPVPPGTQPTGFVQNLQNFLSGIPGAVVDAAGNIRDAAGNIISNVASFLGGIPGQIANSIPNNLGQFGQPVNPGYGLFQGSLLNSGVPTGGFYSTLSNPQGSWQSQYGTTPPGSYPGYVDPSMTGGPVYVDSSGYVVTGGTPNFAPAYTGQDVSGVFGDPGQQSSAADPMYHANPNYQGGPGGWAAALAGQSYGTGGLPPAASK